MIKPTVGRVVWYWPEGPGMEQPHAALVTYVHSDELVNLAVFNANGEHGCATSVKLFQGPDDSKDRPKVAHATWMPYQKGQAAKTDELQKQLAPTGGAPDSQTI